MKTIDNMKMAVLAVGLSVAGAASADLPTWATDIGTEATSTVASAAALVGPAIAASIIAVIAIKLIKRFSNRI